MLIAMATSFVQREIFFLQKNGKKPYSSSPSRLLKYGRTSGKEEGKKAEERKNSSNLSSPFFFFVSPCLTKLFFLLLGHMTDLINTEKDLVVSLKDYIKAEESKLEQIKK